MSLNGKTAAQTERTITNLAPWPEVPVQPFVDLYRLPGEYSEKVITEQLLHATVFVNQALSRLELPLPLVELEQPRIDGTGLYVYHYLRAVYDYARAHLTWLFETVNRRDAAEIQGDRAESLDGYWLDQSQQHINQLFKALSETPGDAGGVTQDDSFDGFVASLI